MQPNAHIPMNIPLREEQTETAAIVAMRFWVTHENVLVSKPGEPEKWDTRAHEWCLWAKKGVGIPMTTIDKVARLRKDPVQWRALERAYENWKSGGTASKVAAGHTALDAWSGVTRDEVEVLDGFKVYSVEDFAELTDSTMGRIPLRDMAARRERARKFLDTQKTADTVKAMLGDENAKLKADLDKSAQEMVAMKEQMAAMMSALKAAAEDRPARARPKRVKAEGVEAEAVA